LLVILSRVTDMSDVIFVGTKAQTIEAIRQVMAKRSPLMERANYVLGRLGGRLAIDGAREDFVIPDADTWCVYTLYSLRHPSVFYTGKTKNMSRRLGEHNGGHGSAFTSQTHLRPLGIVALLTGFTQDAAGEAKMNQTERQLHVLFRRNDTLIAILDGYRQLSDNTDLQCQRAVNLNG
jgi:predicted GIY-YIG superfamily endonuclease